MTRTTSICLLVITLCIAAGPAQAGLPAMPAIPEDLPEEVRETLIVKRAPLAHRKLALIEEGELFNQTCVNLKKGSSRYQDCAAKQAQFNAKVEALRIDMAKLVEEIHAASAAEKRRRATPNLDPSVVDARVPRDGAHLIAQVPELERSPAADRITKGFQAVIHHNWPVALAWWQDALRRDPTNAALQRSVDLAQWMVNYRATAPTESGKSFEAAIHAAADRDYAEAVRLLERAKVENPAIAPHADRMITAIEQQAAQRVREATVNWQIERQTRAIVEALHDRGINMLTIGDERGAQEAFRDADFFSMGLPPSDRSDSPTPTKSGKTTLAEPPTPDLIGK